MREVSVSFKIDGERGTIEMSEMIVNSKVLEGTDESSAHFSRCILLELVASFTDNLLVEFEEECKKAKDETT